MKSIFLSHSSKDKFIVRELARKLSKYGVKSWVDEAEIKIGDSLIQKISEGIKESDFFGVVLTKNSINSEWVKHELNIALNKEILSKKVIVLPLVFEEGLEIPIFLSDKKYADFSDQIKYEKTFKDLLRALGIKNSREDIKVPLETKQKIIQNEIERFSDIEIINLDTSKTYKPDINYDMHNVYFEISRSPVYEWKEIFNAERYFPRHTMWRRAWIEGKYIVIYCVLDEVEKYHFRDLLEDVKNTNMKYREYLCEKEFKEKQQRNKIQKEKGDIENLKNKLGF